MQARTASSLFFSKVNWPIFCSSNWWSFVDMSLNASNNCLTSFVMPWDSTLTPKVPEEIFLTPSWRTFSSFVESIVWASITSTINPQVKANTIIREVVVVSVIAEMIVPESPTITEPTFLDSMPFLSCIGELTTIFAWFALLA